MRRHTRVSKLVDAPLQPRPQIWSWPRLSSIKQREARLAGSPCNAAHPRLCQRSVYQGPETTHLRKTHSLRREQVSASSWAAGVTVVNRPAAHTCAHAYATLDWA